MFSNDIHSLMAARPHGGIAFYRTLATPATKTASLRLHRQVVECNSLFNKCCVYDVCMCHGNIQTVYVQSSDHSTL